MSDEKPGSRQLARLEVLLDIIFGITIWRLFLLLPKPQDGNLGVLSVAEFISGEWHLFAIVCIGIVIVIIYWLQNNALFSQLVRTDAIHTGISVFQVVFVMFLLYAIRLGIHFEGDRGALLMESLATLLLGLSSFVGWRYAIGKGDLISPDLQLAEAQEISKRTMAEPITAGITIPCAFIGPIFWELSWFFYPVFVYLLRIRKLQRLKKYTPEEP